MKLKIKNIGPFCDSTLNIGDITIIAGINDTGKSYLSKLIFVMIKIATSDIKTEIIENFFNFVKDIFMQLESTSNNFLTTNFNNNEKESTFFKEITTIYHNLNLTNKVFIEKWITNFNNKTEKFNDFWIKLLTNYQQLLTKNDHLIAKTLQQIALNTNKDKNCNSYIIEEDSLEHINEALNYPYRELDKYEFKWDLEK